MLDVRVSTTRERAVAGPFLQAAFFCERVLQEADGTVSAIRIIDQQTLSASGADVPSDMPPAIVNTTMLIALKAGETRGRYAIKIGPEAPSGLELPSVNVPVNFPGGDGEQGINIIIPMQMQVIEEGLYWFDVVWVDDKAGADGDRQLTRVPLRVLYQPLATR
jgi:hypothetical protein